jgi:predicted PP-loop superfamily ATPase
MLSRKTWKIEAHKDLNPNTMAAGERICLGYAYSFAVRKVLNLNLPAVFDAPYGRLDEELKQVIRAFVKEQPCQQVILGSVLEFGEQDKPDYILDYKDDYSRVIKN